MLFESEPQADRRHRRHLHHDDNPSAAWGEGRIQLRNSWLYEMGRLSSGRAAELAGLSRVEFLLSMERYRVFPLQHELQELEKAHH
jgi:hypothetical protein